MSSEKVKANYSHDEKMNHVAQSASSEKATELAQAILGENSDQAVGKKHAAELIDKALLAAQQEVRKWSGWKTIDTAPKDGSLFVAWSEKFDGPCFLRWKTNPRYSPPRSYFGDPEEMDDYEMADHGPTHWHQLYPLPTDQDVPQAAQAREGGPKVHPNRTTRITEEQARLAVTHFANRHFDNPGDKSRASIPAHQDDVDILLSDYITQRETDLQSRLAAERLDEAKWWYVEHVRPWTTDGQDADDRARERLAALSKATKGKR